MFYMLIKGGCPNKQLKTGKNINSLSSLKYIYLSFNHMNLFPGTKKSSKNLSRNTPPQEKYNFSYVTNTTFMSSLCEESGIKLYSRCFYWTNVSPPKELTRWLVLSWNITQQTDGLVSTPTLYNAKINEVYIYTSVWRS